MKGKRRKQEQDDDNKVKKKSKKRKRPQQDWKDCDLCEGKTTDDDPVFADQPLKWGHPKEAKKEAKT